MSAPPQLRCAVPLTWVPLISQCEVHTRGPPLRLSKRITAPRSAGGSLSTPASVPVRSGGRVQSRISRSACRRMLAALIQAAQKTSRRGAPRTAALHVHTSSTSDGCGAG